MFTGKKNLSLCGALGLGVLAVSTGAAAADDPFTLTADDLLYDNSTQTVTASGNVRIESPDGAVQAEKIIYNRETGTLTASGNVVYINRDNVAIFADNLELSEDLRDGAINLLQLRLGDEGAKLAAKTATREDGRYMRLHNAVYSPCTACDDNATTYPWQVRAKTVTYDQQAQRVSYKHAYLDIYGTPVLYLPYLSHSVGQQTRASGFLPPRFGRSTNRGEEMTLSYYHALSDQQDVTVRARTMTRRGVMGIIDHRALFGDTASDFRASLIADDKTATLRSHVAGSAEHVFAPGTRLGANVNVASDDTYLDDFFGENPSYLSSVLYGETAGQDHYYALYGTWYQDLRENNDPAEIAQLVPRMQLARQFQLNRWGATFNASADFLTLHRGEGIRSRRMVANSELVKPIIMADGSRLRLTAGLRADGYHVDGNATSRNGFTGRILPQATVSWDKPFSSTGGQHIITPRVMLIAAPRGGNPSGIPNEDSVAYELDTTNLFDSNRFAGYDRLESGPRIVYGLDNRFGSNGDMRWRLFFGQSIRLFDEAVLPALGGTATRHSDWVALARMQPADWFSLDSQMRLDNATFEARRLDTTLTLGNHRSSYLNTTYSFLDDGPEEISMRGRFALSPRLALFGENRQDLTEGGKNLLSEGGLELLHNCYRLSFSAKRRGFTNQDVAPATEFVFNLELFTLGSNEHF